MADRQVEGVDLDQLEDQYQAFEAAVLAAMKSTMRGAVKDDAIAGTLARLSLDDLNVIPPLWSVKVPDLAMHVQSSFVEAANQQLLAYEGATGRIVDMWTSEHDAAVDYLSQATNRLAGIGDDLWADARTELLAGLDLGEDIGTISARVRKATDVTGPRATMIARTEIVGASSAGSIAFMRATGEVSDKRWLATNDARTRAAHRAANGQVVPIEAKFNVGGALLDHPGDPNGPADTVCNCRCTLTWVLHPDSAENQVDGGSLAASAQEASMVTTTTEIVIWPEAGTEHELDDDALTAAALDAMGGDTAAWEGVICVTGTPTGDRRQFDSLSWAELPLPLRRNIVESHGGIPQTQAVLVGRIDQIEMRQNEVWASGVIDLGSESGRETARLMGTREAPGFLRGVSIDGDEEPGNPATIESVFPADCADLAMADGAPSMEDMARCMEPELSIWSHARIRGATLTDIAALTQANLYLTDMAVDPGAMVMPGEEEYPMHASVTDIHEPTMADVVESLTAAAHTVVIPDVPLAEWFTEPVDFPQFGGIEITDSGRIFGYVAPAGQQHRSYIGSGKRVTTPMGNVDYGLWETRARVVDLGDGTTKRIATGPITLDCGHASIVGPQSRSGAVAMEHYESSCSLFATACIGENKHGVWIAGALLPDIGPAQVARALACQLSGDWRPHSRRQGMREFAGCLLVPVPGLPASNRKGASTTYRGESLVASAVPVRFGSEMECEPCVRESEVDSLASVNAADILASKVGRSRIERAAELTKMVRG